MKGHWSSVLRELDDGRWFWPFDQWKDFNDERPYQPRTLGFSCMTNLTRSWGA